MESTRQSETSLPAADVTLGFTRGSPSYSLRDGREQQSFTRLSTFMMEFIQKSSTSSVSSDSGVGYGYVFSESSMTEKLHNTSTTNMSAVVNNTTFIPGLYDFTGTMGYTNSNCYNGCVINESSSSNYTDNITTTINAPISPHLQIQVTIVDIVIAFTLSLFIICIIIGNILVISSVILFREMRTLTNALIASLAIADLLVAIIVLPISLHFEIMDHVWTLGPIVCDFWITSDVFCCTASILNIVVIAMDRYWLITRNVRYTHNVRLPRKRVCLVMVSLAWILSTVISVSPLFGWRAGSEKTDYMCVISQDLGYTVFSTFGAFWFPLSIILITYFQIFKVARKRARSRMKSRSICPSINTSQLATELPNGGVSSVKVNRHSDSGEMTPPASVIPNNNTATTNGSIKSQPSEDTNGGKLVSPVNESTLTDVTTVQNNNTYMETAINSTVDEQQPIENAEGFVKNSNCHEKEVMAKGGNNGIASKPVANGNHSSVKRTSTTFTKKSSSSSQNSYFRCKNRRQFQRLGQCRSSRMRRRNKMRSSARTLGLIIGCFVFCWMPFFLVASVLPFCKVCTDNMPVLVQSITLWLGYSNSLLNPAIYAIWDKNFRRSFKKVIKCHINWSYVFYN